MSKAPRPSNRSGYAKSFVTWLGTMAANRKGVSRHWDRKAKPSVGSAVHRSSPPKSALTTISFPAMYLRGRHSRMRWPGLSSKKSRVRMALWATKVFFKKMALGGPVLPEVWTVMVFSDPYHWVKKSMRSDSMPGGQT